MSSINPSASGLDTSKTVFPTELGIKTPEQKQVYASALEFERYFVQQLLKPMQDAGKMLGGDDEGGSAGTSGYSDMAQDQMTQAVLDGGGLGIASTMYTQMANAAGIATAPTAPAPTAAATAAAAATKVGDAA